MTTREARELIAWTIMLVAAVAVLAWIAYLALDALLLIYVSVLLAIGFGPIVRVIERRPFGRLPRWFAILIVYLLIVAALTIAGFLVIPTLVGQAHELWTRLPSLIDRVQTFLIDRGLLKERISLAEAVRGAPGTPAAAVGTVAAAIGNVFQGVLAFITLLILTFYLLVESDALFAAFARLFPREARPRVVDASRKISAKVSAWLSGQLILAGVIGTSAAAGLWLLGVPYFYVLALIAAIGEMIPILGPILSAVPAILSGLTVSPQTGLFVALFWLAQQQIENNLLVPKIMERQVGVSPVVVIVALMIGGSVFGIVGAILAVPTAGIIQVIINELLDESAQRSAKE
jgi:predicted PurR-regulated permease PerM